MKRAVEIARQKAGEFLPGESFPLEEIERETYRNRDVWSITLSMPDVMPTPESTPFFLPGRRQYKRFLVDVETGDFVAMKVREVAMP